MSHIFASWSNIWHRRPSPQEEPDPEESDEERNACFHFNLGQEVTSQTSDHTYRVLERHHGGFGAVYVVMDTASGQRSALKALRKDLLAADVVTSFQTEALVWVMMEHHPNIASALWMEEIDGVLCLMLEYVPGGSLAARIRSAPIAEAEALRLALQVCDAMRCASESFGLIHLDLKPSNCLMADAGVLKVSDFGLARSVNAALLLRESSSFQARTSHMHGSSSDQQEDIASNLATGASEHPTPYCFAGTQSYMAPEQFETTRTPDTRCDIFAFGVSLFEMLTQLRPSFGPAALSFFASVSAPYNLNSGLLEFILRCVAPNPDDRPASFQEAHRLLTKLYLQRVRRTYAALPRAAMSARDWQNKAVAFDLLKLHGQAEACTKRALSLAPNDCDLLFNIGMLLFKQDRFKEAVATFERAINVAPKVVALWRGKAMALNELPDLDAAVRFCNDALGRFPDDSELLKSKGVALQISGDHAAALDCYLMGARLAPEDGDFFKNIAALYCDWNKPQEALEYAIAGTQKAPWDPYQWQNLGISYDKLARHAEALEAFARGLELDPGHIQLLEHTAHVRSKTGCLEKLPEARSTPCPQPPDIPDCRLVEPLEFDGVGELWVAEDRKSGKTVLVRFLSSARRPVSIEEERRFDREVELSLRLSHPHIVQARTRGEYKGTRYLLLEHCPGKTAECLRLEAGGRLPPVVAVTIAIQVLEAVHYFHFRRNPIINRDIRPQNIIVSGSSTHNYHIRIANHGAARTLGNQCFSSLTVSGVVRGCVPFIPPEQILHSHKVDHRADLFAVGATLYHLLTGRYIYPFRETEAAMLTICRASISFPLDWNDCPLQPTLAAVVERAVDPNPRKRYQNARAMQEAVRKTTRG